MDKDTKLPRLPPCIIRPDNGWKKKWDICVGILIIYSIIVVPMRVGFAWRACIFSGEWWLDVVVDFCFAVDIILAFRSALLLEVESPNQQLLVMRPLAIARRYLCGWFILDTLSTVPVESFVDVASYAHTGSIELVCAAEGGVFKSMQTLRMLRLVRLLKLFRFLKLGNAIKKLEDRADMNPAYFRFARLFIGILFLSHLVACLYAPRK